MEAKALCPITGEYAILEKRVPTKTIIDGYRSDYKIDVESLFKGKTDISIFRSPETHLRFFGPEDIAGDGNFYEKLQSFPWYYMDWKWEHQVIKNLLRPDMKVLEIGCGEGAFLEGIKDVCPNGVGLELNQAATQKAQANGLDVHYEPVQLHADYHAGEYDVVCSFQVMEHVTDIRGIIESSLRCLKPGGKLIISVPNNESFIKYSPDSLLNMPPHHMNLWDSNSLTRISHFFDMNVEGFLYEPIQKYHYQFAMSSWIRSNIKPLLFAKVVNKINKMLRLYKTLHLFRNKIKGHSIIAIYTKEQ